MSQARRTLHLCEALLFSPSLVSRADRIRYVAGLAQSVERLTAEREVAGSIPGAGPLLRVLK